MKRALLAAALAAIFGVSMVGDAMVSAAQADSSRSERSASYRKKKPQVRGYVARRGGYSYSYSDSIDTYGSARTVTGGSRYYRDANLDRQTTSGPFDHGFFFDSGVAPRGGDSPYMH